MESISFAKAADRLAAQLQSNIHIQRIGVVLRAALTTTTDATKRIDSLLESAVDNLKTAMEQKLADFHSVHQRNAVILGYAGALRVPVKEQLAMLNVGRHSEAVTSAAAKQFPAPSLDVQLFLVNECSKHRSAMIALANHRNADLQALEILASNPDKDVRRALAANIGARMRIMEPELTENKAAVYNALLNHYDSSFAPYLVPVCRDESQLAQMYAESTKTPSVGRLFIENPYTPDGVLHAISVSVPMRLMPGGFEVADDAEHQIVMRLNAQNDIAPDPN